MRWQQWLPSPQQMSNAAQMRPNAYTGSTMQQALGMVVLLGLLAGVPPFIVNWIGAVGSGAVLPVARLAGVAEGLAEWDGLLRFVGPLSPQALAEVAQTLAGLEQPLPLWLAAGLSSLGKWLNWPLGWIALWIVYGAGVMLANKALGGHVTLQRFYAATGFAAVPLLFTGLLPIPCLGLFAGVGAVGWSLAVYIRANAEVTGLSMPRAVAAVLLPAPVGGLIFLFLAGIFTAILTPLLF
ncbi:MAG: hypothetical protein KJZ86_09115 [Caldilineaceae bacterium]|nr:hypothetical protein [Caldilineaceae bacterium]